MGLWTGTPGSIDEDIAPSPGGDGIVNFLDVAAVAENWLHIIYGLNHYNIRSVDKIVRCGLR